MADIEVPSNPTTDTTKSSTTPKKKSFNKNNDKKTSRHTKTNKKPEQNDQKKSRPMTTGMALLQAMTAKKAATDAMIKSAKAKVHVSFDDDGEIATPTEEEKDTKVNEKKRKEPDTDNNTEVPKKEKKKKGTHHLRGPSDKKKQEALDSLQLFVTDRSQWKFNKKHQSWLLQHIYDTEAISTEDFDRVLLYIKDIMGMAREKTLKEAETICQETRGSTVATVSTTTPSETTYTGYDDDDFDAEKLLAAAPAPTPAPAPVPTSTNETNDDSTTTNSDDSTKLERAKAVVKTLM